MHAVIPRHMMKPEQKLFGASGEVREAVAHFTVILAHGVAACFRAVKSEAAIIGAMVVNRILVLALLAVPPRSRAVMMPAPHNVMQTERRHIIHERLV